MEVVLDSVKEELPKDRGGRVFTFLADFLHVDSLALNWDKILIFFAEQTWDFTSSKHRVDSFEESFLFDFSVGHKEADRATLGASLLVEKLDIVEERCETVGFGQGNLEEEVTADRG